MSLADEVRALQISKEEANRIREEKKRKRNEEDIRRIFNDMISKCKNAAAEGSECAYLIDTDYIWGDRAIVLKGVIEKLRLNGFKVGEGKYCPSTGPSDPCTSYKVTW